MNKAVQILLCLLFSVLSGHVLAQSTVGEPQLSVITTEDQQEEQKKVTAVYGVTADDYLPASGHTADDYLRPKTRRPVSRPSFNLPEPFYFIGGPVFLLILLRVIVIFLNGFEEKRKDEENQVASEHFNPE
jgi:hypothetical protein